MLVLLTGWHTRKLIAPLFQATIQSENVTPAIEFPNHLLRIRASKINKSLFPPAISPPLSNRYHVVCKLAARCSGMQQRRERESAFSLLIALSTIGSDKALNSLFPLRYLIRGLSLSLLSLNVYCIAI